MKIKRILIIFLLVIGVYVFSSSKVVNAATNDSGTTSYSITKTEMTKNTTLTRFKYDVGCTITNAKSTSQHVFVYTQKQTSNSKVVTWAVKEDSGVLRRTTVAGICADYEKTHPDWKVIGAINADQYITGFGTDIGGKGQDYYYPQPYYPMIADGEGWFIITGMPSAGGSNFVSILQDGSVDPLVNGSSNIRVGNVKVEGLFLYIIDEDNNRLEKFSLSAINETPLAGESSVWVSYKNEKKEYPKKSLSGNLFVVKNAERAYASNSIDYQYKGDNAMNAFFGKGYITSACESAEIGYGDFAIESNNEELSAKLKAGVRVMVQYEFEGDYSNVESAIGFHTIHRMDDKDLTTTASYNTSKYPRAIIGRTAIGEIVLMAIDGKQDAIGATGATFNETNAILKEYGVVEAYQMDGGGSVTAVLQGDTGFTTVNSPCDGAPRSVFSALLMVERRKPDIEMDVLDYDDKSTTIKMNIDMHGCPYKKLQLEIGSNTYDIEEKDGEFFVVTGRLRRQKEYEYKLIVTTEKDEVLSSSGLFTLPPLKPTLTKCEIEVNGNERIFNIILNDKDETITSYYILINGTTYQPVDNKIVVSTLDGVPYLKIVYDVGKGEEIITIKYPQSVALRNIDDAFLYYKDFLNNMK